MLMHRLTRRNIWARGSPNLNPKIVIIALHEQNSIELKARYKIPFIQAISILIMLFVADKASSKKWRLKIIA